ncbi:hypothetical protein OG612_34425 [Streptomyces sp. NBC_01527]|nr:hypothetical protein OG763_08435 [Streptomyces sp. NBC_01230]
MTYCPAPDTACVEHRSPGSGRLGTRGQQQRTASSALSTTGAAGS